MSTHTLLLLVGLLVLYIVKSVRMNREKTRSARHTRLPGPIGIPFLGIVLELPEANSFIKFHEWGQHYGPIYRTVIAGRTHIWICRDALAKDMLCKKGNKYSDRPHITALQYDNRSSMQYLPLMSTTKTWLRQRKFAKQIMDTASKSGFYGYPAMEAIRLLYELGTGPQDDQHSLESFVARVTCRLAWSSATASDELQQRARELLIGVSPAGAVGNRFPTVMSLPTILSPPKAWEMRRARTEKRFFEIMADKVAHSVGAGSLTTSWMRQYLENRAKWGFESDLEGASAVGMHGIAGALTIAAPMQSFCLAMCHHPQYQSILHEEIDRVCGDEMPSYSRIEEMPVLRAFIRETMRWRPPVPTGIPHECSEDDVHNGYFIPKGSILHPLEWSIGRDPAIFPDPDNFNPLRWLDPAFPSYREPLSKHPTITEYSQFGYGKRTCLGMGVTEANLFVGIGALAWMFSMNLPGSAAAATAAASPSETLARKDSAVDLAGESKIPEPTAAIELQHDGMSAEQTPMSDPTLRYTKLLIAKPLPFELELHVRHERRMDYVKRRFAELEAEGEFEEAECFWEGGNEGNREFGWGKV